MFNVVANIYNFALFSKRIVSQSKVTKHDLGLFDSLHS